MSCVTFRINGKPYTVNADIPVNTSLNTFIRNHAQLTGTKLCCNEGGCGVCIVSVKKENCWTKKVETLAVNSCLALVYSFHNADVTTIEGMGNKKDGLWPEQSRLLEKNGSQCGYCTSGMLTNMYCLRENNLGTLTMKQVEDSFDGNLCRCTGYRPILDAFKSFAVDADNTLLCHDIEDLPNVYTGKTCDRICQKAAKESFRLKLEDGAEWHKVYTINEILQTLKETNLEPYILLAGNTAHGVFPLTYDIKLYIDINDVADLHSYSMIDNELVVGANNSLKDTRDIFEAISETPGFEYCLDLAKHIDLIAHTPVRNIGTIAGNLSIKHQHNRFPSDMFVILEAVGAKMTIIDANNNRSFTIEVAKYLKVDMKKKVIVNVKLPTLASTLFKFRSYKIMLRAQNCEAYVNAAFLLKFKSNFVESARICFGGINGTFVHATDTEAYLRGKNLHTNKELSIAIEILRDELNPDENLTDASPEYRRRLAISLFYKFVLSTCNENLIRPEHRSGANILRRPLSSGKQTYDTQKNEYPLTEPIVKNDGVAQVSGAAKYTNDVPHFKDELWAAFVTAKKVHYKIGNIDASEALKIPGVRYFFSAADIPGNNSFTPTSSSLIALMEDEKIFVELKGDVLFYDQPVGVILADTSDLANLAATKVLVTYTPQDDSYLGMARTILKPWLGETPILPTIKDVFDSKTKYKDSTESSVKHLSDGTKIIKGRVDFKSQYHFHMEPQTTVCIPSEDGIIVYTSTQWVDLVTIAISECLKQPANVIQIVVTRLGGSYGGKVSRSSQIACACALACYRTGKAVRFVMTLPANMSIIGKRNGMMGDYTVVVDANGKIKKLDGNAAHDIGCSYNESPAQLAQGAYPNCYDASSWNINGVDIKTDAPSQTWCRAPGTLEGIAMAETIMEHIACVTGKDPTSVRIANLVENSRMKELIPSFLEDIEFNNRKKKVDEFNKKNRWNKKGIAVVTMRYPILYFFTNTAYVCVYHGDGTVIVSHGGIEMGQGVNTKVTQVAAHILGIPHTFVNVRATDNVIGANCLTTGGSITSDMICLAVMKACEEIKKRLKPIIDANKNAQWVEITRQAFVEQISLSAVHTVKANELTSYDVLGLTCAEIETDILTGNIQLLRVDILEDAGQSMNPLIDIGQIEGAFLMGVGYWLTELLKYDRTNGELLTNRSWNYKPPSSKDIPIDWRITLLQKSSNPALVLRSKAVGEPAITMSIAVIFALRYALKSARRDAGIKNDPWFNLPTPATPEVISLTAGHSTESFTI